MELELRTRKSLMSKVLKRIVGKLVTVSRSQSSKIRDTPTSLVLDSLQQAGGVVCLDLFQTHQAPMAPLLPFVIGNPKISLFHGIDAPHADTCPYGPADYRPEIFPGSTILAQGKSEAACYATHLPTPPKSVGLVGIPRHDQKWIDKLNERERNPKPKPKRSFIYVLSRPSTTYYLTKKQKRTYLRSIKEAASLYDLDVVIKMHPKEHNDNTFQQIFGKKNFGVNWWFSNRHPLTMASGCIGAVTFHSGTSVDMARIGVPVIEYLDPEDLSPNDGVFKYRKAGFVLPSSNHKEFLAQFDHIFHHRDQALADLQNKISLEFPQKDDPNEFIAQKILSRFSP